ncbi:hypothetical protein SNEBB_003529 [Seison nebaliae]|nr:hypothetical protein SNEBB_003529 [Seison nebaliae]
MKFIIHNLPWALKKGDLVSHLIRFGRVKDLKIIFNRETCLSRGFAFFHVDGNDAQKFTKINKLRIRGHETELKIAK